jgi:hypothetical protein
MGHPLVVVTVSVGIVVVSRVARRMRCRSYWYCLFQWGQLVTFALVILAAIANFRIKLSLHALFAFYCSAILFRINPFLGGVALALALILFWSRLYLQRMIWRKCRPELCSDWAAAWSQFGGREE